MDLQERIITLETGQWEVHQEQNIMQDKPLHVGRQAVLLFLNTHLPLELVRKHIDKPSHIMAVLMRIHGLAAAHCRPTSFPYPKYLFGN